MARSYFRHSTSIWRDEDFRDLTAAQQALYFLIGGQTEVTAAGTLPLRPRRWAQMAADWTVDSIADELQVLVERGHLVVDEDTEEVLIVKFVKWDGGYTNSKRVPVIRESAMDIESPNLRRILRAELQRLGLLDMASALGADRPADRQPDRPSPEDRLKGVKTEGEINPYLNPQPTTPAPVAQRDPAPKRGSRIDPNWRPDDPLRAWTLHRLTPTDAQLELEKFRNYWKAKTGKDATKLDWPAVWRNWVLNSNHARPTNGHGPATAKATGWLTVDEDLPNDHPAEIEGRTP